ncbi:MAG: hypothetical protein IKL54_04960 [Bacteroidaceae bacterium]|nr:hypothetical protein [Bacteroidaceae bacterium]
MIIAVDFDGTIVEHKYPEIGRERPFAITTLKMLIEQRHRLILWTVRKGHLLQEAVDWCKERGVEFYAVNKNYPEEQVETDGGYSKINAEIFIDDCNLGGIPDWGKIYQMITEKKSWEDIYHSAPVEEETPKKKKKGWFW